MKIRSTLAASLLAFNAIAGNNTAHGDLSLELSSGCWGNSAYGYMSMMASTNCHQNVVVGEYSAIGTRGFNNNIVIGNNTISSVSNVNGSVFIGNGDIGAFPFSGSTVINGMQLLISKPFNAFCLNPSQTNRIRATPFYLLDDTIHFNAGSVDFTGQNVKGLHVDSQQDHISDSTNFVYCNLDVILNKQERGPGHGYWTCKRDMNDQPYEEMTDTTFSWDANSNAWKNDDSTFLTIENGYLVFRNEGLMPGESRSVAFTGWDATYTAEMWNWFFYRHIRYHTDAPEVHTKLVTTNDVGNAVGATFRFENGQFCVYTNGMRAGTLAFTPN